MNTSLGTVGSHITGKHNISADKPLLEERPGMVTSRRFWVGR
jgi:hypothetical protein